MSLKYKVIEIIIFTFIINKRYKNMFDKRKTGNSIIDRRRELGMTQRQRADKLSIYFQSVSK
jgi:hypothetical protein